MVLDYWEGAVQVCWRAKILEDIHRRPISGFLVNWSVVEGLRGCRVVGREPQPGPVDQVGSWHCVSLSVAGPSVSLLDVDAEALN